MDTFNPNIYDLSRIICFLLPVTTATQYAFDLEHNRRQKAPLLSQFIEKPGPEIALEQVTETSPTEVATSREVTPIFDSVNGPPFHVLAITTDIDRLFDPKVGHIFGSGSDSDILLDRNFARGVSTKHFRLFIDENAGRDHNLTLENLSRNVIEAVSLEAKLRKTLKKRQLFVLNGGEWTVILNVQDELELKIIFPDHGESYHQYQRNWELFRAANEAASNPKFVQSSNEKHLKETPLFQESPFRVLKERLGEGAFAEVRKATGHNKEVLAAKVFKNRIDGEKELQILRVIRHKHVITYKAFVHEKDHDIIYMEYLSGGTLSTKLKDNREYPLVGAKLYWLQLAEGLRYLHSKYILHRDLKPDNILFDSQGIIKICDFGISKQLATAKDTTRTQTGSPHYAAPEILEGQPYSYSSDIWSLGIVVLEMYRRLPPIITSWRIAAGKNSAWDAWMALITESVEGLPKDLTILGQQLILDQRKRPSAEDIVKSLKIDTSLYIAQKRELPQDRKIVKRGRES